VFPFVVERNRVQTMVAFLSFAVLVALLAVALPALVIEVGRELEFRRRSRLGGGGRGSHAAS